MTEDEIRRGIEKIMNDEIRRFDLLLNQSRQLSEPHHGPDAIGLGTSFHDLLMGSMLRPTRVTVPWVRERRGQWRTIVGGGTRFFLLNKSQRDRTLIAIVRTRESWWYMELEEEYREPKKPRSAFEMAMESNGLLDMHEYARQAGVVEMYMPKLSVVQCKISKAQARQYFQLYKGR